MRWFIATAFVFASSSFACSSTSTESGRAPVTANAARASAHAATPSATAASPDAEDPLPGPPPATSMAQGDALYRDQLATQGRDDRFSTDRQLAALRQAILLYEQFIARAGDDPRYADAVRRSRDRIADAKETLNFLQHGAETP